MGENRQLASVVPVTPTSPLRPGRIERLRRFLSRVPLVVVALVLIVPAMYVRLGWLAAFLPGAVRRLNWRHGLVMAGLALVFDLGNDAVKSLNMADTPYPTVGLARDFLMILILGTAEGLLTRAWSWRGFGLLAAAGAAGALVLGMADSLLYWSGWLLCLPQIFTYGVQYHLSSLLACPLLLAWAWTTTPAALRHSPVLSRRGWLTVAGGVAATAAAFVLFYGLVAYDFAEWGMTGRGPVARCYAALILEFRGRSSDFDLIWHQVETADWRKAASPGILLERWQAGNEDDEVDWRRWAVQVLCRHDSPAAADRLSALLLAHPSPTLAQHAAPVLAENHRYETVPILMRFALCPGRGTDKCEEALEKMRVPQAALIILRFEACLAQWRNGQDGTARDFNLPEKTRERLKQLLGVDVGPNYRAWARVYDESLSELPSAVPESIRTETDRVVQCFVLYWNALNRQYEASRELSRRLLVNDGKGQEVESLRAWYEKYGDQAPGPGLEATVTPEIKQSLEHVQPYLDAAAARLRVQPPDWSAPSTDAFIKEIVRFDKQVDAAIARNLPPEPPRQPA